MAIRLLTIVVASMALAAWAGRTHPEWATGVLLLAAFAIPVAAILVADRLRRAAAEAIAKAHGRPPNVVRILAHVERRRRRLELHRYRQASQNLVPNFRH